MFDSFKQYIYIQIAPDRLSVKNLKSGECISEVPELAISAPPDQKILGVGAAARSSIVGKAGAVVLNPFAHPRSLVSDFTVAQQLIKAFVKRVKSSSAMAMSPIIIFHPLGNPDGGFTQVEGRAFRELAFGAGAYKVILWYGDELTDQEILSGQYPAYGRVIE
ncbi:rod shape-determining protein [Undibacterium sp. TC9W]|uniref:rod shape-determining protein n=1 Tax=Undibacterium sp. TC9W TaxID=3413053 RepID=UPI003BF1F99C